MDSVIDVKRQAPIFALLIAVFYVSVPLFILFGVVDFDYKFVALTVGGLLVYICLRMLGFTNGQLGLRGEGWKRSLILLAPVTAIIAVATAIAYLIGGSRYSPAEGLLFFAFYVLISCPVQEFLYRGALAAAGSKFNIPISIQIIGASALYSFVHIIYRDLLTLAFTFLIGLIWYGLYLKARNLLGVSLSHAVLGIATISLGLVN